MKPIKLNIVSPRGIEATIESDGSDDDAGDYSAIITVRGHMESKKIYGVDPVQSFALGMKLIEELTEDRRIGKDGDLPMNGAFWSIEVEASE